GNDTVISKGDESDYTVGNKWGSDYVENNATGNITWLDSVENVTFGEDNSNTEATTYSYDITLNAGLTDTDGSEILSDITIDNIPDGTTIDGLTPNSDGSYTVTADENGDATVTLTSNSEIVEDDLSGITASVTSTETNGDTSTVIVNDDADLESMGEITNDEFTFDNDDFDLNFDNLDFDDTSLTEINTIDMSDGDHEMTNIDINDVMDMTGESNTLTIFGDDEDVVTLDTDTWSQGEDVTIGNDTFATFSGNSVDGLEEVQLMIDTHVQVDQS
ncbi:MAG: hypothetical protein KAJ49_09335, partial [Arcobacteraceae bacterium]|nr:hypothetical protein [Arcobacteraceae bacterium]